MSRNTQIRNLLLSKSKTAFNDILEEMLLSDKEKQMMQLFYLERKDLGYIADVMGYTKSGVSSMHKRVLRKIERML